MCGEALPLFKDRLLGVSRALEALGVSGSSGSRYQVACAASCMEGTAQWLLGVEGFGLDCHCCFTSDLIRYWSKFLDNLLDGRQDQTYALLRIVTGFLFIWHGAQKLFNFPADFPYPLNPLMYTAGTIELVSGLLVMIGLFTRPAAFICSGTMAAAYWMAHGMNNVFPMLNNGELAALYCFAFLFIAARGPGIWSLDK